MKLAPPDCGIDIYRQSTRDAYQCKSNERGIFGTIDAQQCILSLARASDVRTSVPWSRYWIAMNAPVSGVGLSKINHFATSNALPAVQFLPPEYWSDLCERHTKHVSGLFDYRVLLSETDVIEALRKARYYDDFIKQAEQQIRVSPVDVVVSNNRTPIELSLPFSGELTIRELLDVTQALLGISLEWTEFPDLGTSCGPSLSMTIDQKPQPFSRKLSELTLDELRQLQLWIKLVWRNKLKGEGDHDDAMQFKLTLPESREEVDVVRQVRDLTLGRMELLVQRTIWQSINARPR
jgi:hypothetical protein